MATLIPLNCTGIAANAAYGQLRHTLSEVARIGAFRPGELVRIADCRQAEIVSIQCTDPYFHKSRAMEIYDDVLMMNRCRLALAPILERQHGSLHLCEDMSHALSWFRANIAGHIGNYYVKRDEYPREPNEALMREHLRLMGVKDEALFERLDLHLRGYYCRTAATGKLSNCLFDPIMLFGKYD
jgi:hypothetical protein